jgi:hypothetical protein
MIFSFLQVNDCLAERYHGMPNRGIQRNAKEPAENFTFLLHSGRIQTGFYRQVQGQHRQQRQNNQNHNVHQHVGNGFPGHGVHIPVDQVDARRRRGPADGQRGDEDGLK